ncbi:unnamed protein product [Adineta ricciae]|uniref:Uncharacterized protein n=1 Tax=Adineta ricciae TaxID=249248 RepID=A0A816D4C9_ADIRI|nr:unnamed protein product [Adineta ricciae]
MSDNSTKSKIPSFGEIYYTRHSIREAFELINNNSNPGIITSSSSSVSSSSSSSKYRSRSRPSLCWHIDTGVTILLMATFEGVNPMTRQNDDKSIVDNVSFTNLLKHLVSISPTPPIPGRRSLKIECFNSNNELNEYKMNSYLVLIPIQAKPKTKWTDLFNGSFSSDDLHYIQELLSELEKERLELEKERVAQDIVNFSSKQASSPSTSDPKIPTTRAFNVNIIENDQKTNDDDTSCESSEGSGCCLLIRQTRIDKSDFVQDWLNHTSQEIPGLNLSSLFNE